MSDISRHIRKLAFSTSWELDNDLVALSKDVPSHAFLANPAGQYAYVYLTQYVKALSQQHFGTEFSQLRVLDWGCGKGHVSKLIRDMGPEKLDLCDVFAEKSDSTFAQQVPIIESLESVSIGQAKNLLGVTTSSS